MQLNCASANGNFCSRKILSSYTKLHVGGVGGLMVNTLDSGSSGPGSGPSWDIALCSWARPFPLRVPISTQVYKWVLAKRGE